MLIEFSVANFRSILGRQTLSLVASSSNEHVGRNVAQKQNDIGRVLRSAVIYGPNAAGKSNFFRALQTLQQLIVASASQMQEGQSLGVNPFMLQKASAQQPSEFDIVFVAEDGTRYEYCCVVSADRVHREWLVAYPKGRPQRWFEREYKTDTEKYEWWFGPNFKGERAEKKVWQDFTRSNSLFFSTAIQLNNEQLKPAFNWIAQKLIVLTAGIDLNPFLSLELLKQSEGGNQIMEFMRAADIGIARMEVQEEDLPSQGMIAPKIGTALRINIESPQSGLPAPQQKLIKVLAWHKRTDSGEDIAFDLGDESDGTRKLFEFTGGWVRSLAWGATLFVDELDRSLHPHITRFLVGLFHGRNNPKNAQLVFTTHDTTLLDSELVRRDQVWFVEKDDAQASRLYPLLEYRPRKEEALERGYLKGRYGAVPMIGKLGS